MTTPLAWIDAEELDAKIVELKAFIEDIGPLLERDRWITIRNIGLLAMTTLVEDIDQFDLEVPYIERIRDDANFALFKIGRDLHCLDEADGYRVLNHMIHVLDLMTFSREEMRGTKACT